MDFNGSVLINILSIIMLLVLLTTMIKGRKQGLLSARIFVLTIAVTILMLIFDVLGRMDGVTAFSVPLANRLGNFALFLLNPLPSILWALFIYTQVINSKHIHKNIFLVLLAYYGVHVVATIFNIFFHFFYVIGSDNIYVRGPWFILSIVWVMLPLLVGFFITIVKRKEIEPERFNSFVFYPLAPVVGTVFTLLFYGYSIVLPSMAIAILLVFNSIQNDTIVVDYLTGAYNRRALEDFLRRRIKEGKSNFGAIMLDIDGYKAINDTYGHIAGDQALVDLVKVLRQSVELKDFVARYGGDEFFLVINSNSLRTLELTAEQIQLNLERYNMKSDFPFRINVSKGLNIYEPGLTMEQFIQQLDKKMYADKNTKSK